MMLSEVESWVMDDSDNPDLDLGPPTDRGPPHGGPWGGPPSVGNLGAPNRGPSASAVDLDDFLGDCDQSHASVWSTEADLDMTPMVPSLRDPAAAAAAAAAATGAAGSDRRAAEAEPDSPVSATTTAASRDKSSWPLLQSEGVSGGPSMRSSGGGHIGGPPVGGFSRGAPRGAHGGPRGFSSCCYNKLSMGGLSCRMRWGPACFSSSAHLFDCAITTLSVVLFLNSGDLFILFRGAPRRGAPSGGPRGAPTSSGGPDDFLRELLTALRIATQVVRLVPLAMHQKRAKVNNYRLTRPRGAPRAQGPLGGPD
ncbi:hypothetical protein, conserved [Eimeria maxima]|uniref:Uncharacterized protein n=1 Tax=Eimeria maxima TaxID=5804 RepID=U6M382_EIMMA|nr:hypothetical protein, conserved [Eimeria maxima]CDJ58682.1 hypothetical protein, conserved [Eimeria maxima]